MYGRVCVEITNICNMKNPPVTRGISAKGIRKKRGRIEDSTEERQMGYGSHRPSEIIISVTFEYIMTQI